MTILYIVVYLLGVGSPALAKILYERYWPKLQAVLKQVL